MREIKFRAWDESNNFMWQPALEMNTGRPRFIPLDKEPEKSFRPKAPYVWLQYTGLKDKNGVEIFEGDIVQESDEIDGSKYPAQEVKYIMSAGLIGFYPVIGDTLEVIGNIHENPALLPGTSPDKASNE